MRRIAMIGLVGFALAGATTPRRPVFEYKGFRAGEVAPPEKLIECGAVPDPAATTSPKDGFARLMDQLHPEVFQDDPDNFSCEGARTVAGFPVHQEHIFFHKSRLSGLTITGDHQLFGGITDALKAKYGQPCQTGMKTVQNAMGAKFPSPFYVWCFASGKMRADMRHPMIDTMTVEYEDDWQPPKSRPKIDF